MTRQVGEEAEQESFARKVTVYRIASRAYFHLPIVVVFLAVNGFSTLQIAIFLAVYGLVVSLGDRVVAPMRRRVSLPGSLVVGELVKFLGLVVLLTPLSTESVLLSQILSGLGFCMTAGTDSALASTLRDGERYRQQEARTQMGMFLISFVAGASGALAFGYWHRLPFVLSAFSSLVSAGVIASQQVSLRSNQLDAPASTSSAPDGERGRISVQVRFWSSYYSVIRAVLLSTYTYLLPFFLLFEIHLRVEAFGAVLGLYTLFGLVAARLSLRLTRRPTSRSAFFITGIATVLGLGLLSLDLPWLIAVAIPLLGLAGGFVRPATMIFLGPAMEGLPGSSRQQVLRGLERRQSFIQTGLLLLSGLYIHSQPTLNHAFLGLALISLMYGFFAVVLASQRSRSSVAITTPSPDHSRGRRAGSGWRLSR